MLFSLRMRTALQRPGHSSWRMVRPIRIAGSEATDGVREALVVKATSSGLGLFLSPDSATSLPSGTFISLYAGEYLTTRQARETWAQQHTHHAGEGNYILSLRLPNETIHIDPRYKGNVGRFLNHSCDPNCVIQVVRWGPDSISRAAIFVRARQSCVYGATS